MPLVRWNNICLLAGIFVASAQVAAKTKEAAQAAAKATTNEPKKVGSHPLSPASRVVKSETAEGVTIFETTKSKSRPRVALVVQESADFKNVPLLTGLKTPELAPPEKAPPSAPAAEPTGEDKLTRQPGAAPASSKRSPVDRAAEKVENAAGEAAELPVDLGPIE